MTKNPAIERKFFKKMQVNVILIMKWTVLRKLKILKHSCRIIFAVEEFLHFRLIYFRGSQKKLDISWNLFSRFVAKTAKPRNRENFFPQKYLTIKYCLSFNKGHVRCMLQIIALRYTRDWRGLSATCLLHPCNTVRNVTAQLNIIEVTQFQ